MIRHKRIALASVTLAAAVFGAALAPAAGDQRVTGSPEAKLSYTKDGVPMVRSGPECWGGKAGKSAHEQPDPSDY
jgi:hypothetical protein